MPQISVIVPVYKVETYLKRCVDSILHQTFSDLEVILVDDGSPDQCPDMCDELAKADKRIRVIHKENGGLSSARNAGMRIAQGKYIGFVDSDDDVEPDMYETMLEAVEKNSADFVMSDYIRVSADGTRSLVSKSIRAGVYEKEDIIKEIYPALIMDENVDYGPLLSVWHCLYNRDFLEKNGISFADDVKWSEDNLFSSYVGYCADRFVYLKGQGLYHYYNNPGTITTSYRPGSWNVYKRMNDYLEEFFSSKNDFDFSRQLKLHMIYYACNTVNMECSNAENTKDAKKRMNEILCDPKLKEAFCHFAFTGLPVKLKIQLRLMKYKCTGILAAIIRG